jgi:ParB/RepB/Spo0J family partition protein
MPPKTNDKLAALRARVNDRVTARPSAPASPPADGDNLITAAAAHFTGAVAELVRGRAVERLSVTEVAPELRPEARQARLLPEPHDLLASGKVVPAYAALVSELQELGASLRDRQLQPIVVYPGVSPTYPAARYLILVGQRRWTAAVLAGLDALDAIVVEPPSPEERVEAQYQENEQRADFSDMERAWSLAQLKETMGEAATWEQVEARVNMSRSRRHELTRLLTSFTPDQQRTVALLRATETQLRPLHAAVRAGELTQDHAEQILGRLMTIVLAREAQASGSPRRAGVDGPTVARLVARTRRGGAEPSPSPRWLPPLRESLARAAASLKRAVERAPGLGGSDLDALSQDLDQLEALIAQVREALLAAEANDSRLKQGHTP